ncbi:hypothetical protein [Ammoniphilus sp. YIM 78166]|uniref:hypothetical protein n=1 Tax=Ammoniphilus sp. YIM 78166 TaxID=1644106 RepID=UPI00106F9C61|nr:hypothetical protein [Ammoniphilus sp. YIM 78166]
MVLTKQILNSLDQKGIVDKHTLYLEIDDPQIPDQLAFLCERKYIKQISVNAFAITEKGKMTLFKLL